MVHSWVFGEFMNHSSTSDHPIYFLDTRTWTWTVSNSNAVRGRGYSSCAFVNNQFVIWGGFFQNPTSLPNNLTSLEESTMVYFLAEQNWVHSFLLSNGGQGNGNGSPFSGSGNIGQGQANGDLARPNGTKSIGIILAIAATGAILALLIALGAIITICKRNRRRHANNGRRPTPINTTTMNGQTSTSSGSSSSTVTAPNPSGKKAGQNNKGSHAWEQKMVQTYSASSSSGQDEYTGSVKGRAVDSSSFHTWECQETVGVRQEDAGASTSTLGSGSALGVPTHSSIISTPKN
ncbi:hypothetical protein BGW38_003729 [Lunasporangiospora selenospora]|uniref:Kelch repeat protein n=1 Tax=Lunasporangiospora selenospora TaxID=979761 RepID=A0A9P6FR39_9FUNG|nr:hypothetical protein BGW38_003729 [Lunasporangiospora selenospora]